MSSPYLIIPHTSNTRLLTSHFQQLTSSFQHPSNQLFHYFAAMLKKLLPFILFIGLLTSSNAQEVSHWMISKGFENVQSLSRNDTLFISYENRVYRYEVAAIKEILNTLPIPDGTNTLVIFPKDQNLPTVQLIIPTSLDQYLSKITLKTDLWSSTGFGETVSENQSTFKADLSIGPWIYGTQIGNYDDPIKIELDLAPTLHLQLAKGLKLTGQLLVPVINNYSDDGIRSGILTLEQSIKLPFNTYATASVGQFNPRRYGARLHAMTYTKDGQWGLGTTLGYTQPSSISGELTNDFYENRATHIARVNASWRWLEQDLILSGSFGTFLYQDLGVKVEARRQFKEAQIAVFLQKTSIRENAGFSLFLPIPTKKYSSIKQFRVRTARHLRYRYRFRGQTYGGEEMQPFYDIVLKLTELNPAFLYNKIFE